MSENEVNGDAPEVEESKRPKIATREYDYDNGSVVASGVSVTFNFTDSESLVCDPSELPDEIRARLLLFGIGTRVRNSYASCKGDVAVALQTAKEEWEQLKRGNWTERASGEDSVAPSTKILAECLSEVTGKTIEVCMDVVNRLDKKQRAAVRRDPRISERYEAKRPKKVQKEVDLGALLNA